MKPRLNLNATRLLYLLNAAMWASVGPRLPAISARVHLGTGALGALLTLQCVGLVLATGLGVVLSQRFGVRATAVGAGVVYCLGTALAGVASSTLVLAGAFLVSGLANAPLDLASNSMVSDLGKRLGGRNLQPSMEIAFNLGLLAAAIVGVVSSSQVTLVLLGVCGALLTLATARALPRETDAEERQRLRDIARGVRALRLPALVGIAALSIVAAAGLSGEMMLADWGTLLFGQRFPSAGGSLGWGFLAFIVGLIVSLMVQERAELRFGRVPVTAVGAVVFGLGIAALLWTPTVLLACVALGIAGFGIAPAHPLAIAQSGRMGKVSEFSQPAVLMVGYAGPFLFRPTIGAFAAATSLTVALVASGVAVAALILIGLGLGRREAVA